ncbi:hypothetical protein [Vulcanisaeta souniana]|uniref:hypothetical protein n=1 Tax=Vulcanisaeta souniana TaxID=164452 RepID=UPI001FB292AF|nr:hypothetical protein [Vulcanisaeta souniana]
MYWYLCSSRDARVRYGIIGLSAASTLDTSNTRVMGMKATTYNASLILSFNPP